MFRDRHSQKGSSRALHPHHIDRLVVGIITLVLNLRVSENRGTLFGGPFKGIRFYLGYERDIPPILANTHMASAFPKAFLSRAVRQAA